MITLVRTNAENAGFIALVKLLDSDLAARDGKAHDFYDQFNSISGIRFAVVASDNDLPAGCGAIKEFDARTMEVKRMFVKSDHRSRGIADAILIELERWAAELGASRCVLETGKKQPEAIGFYTRNGYGIIENYGQYAGVDNSICFEKMIG